MRRHSGFLPPPEPPRDMSTAGLEISPTDLNNKRNNTAKREKKGECVTCGRQTHKIPLFGKKTPLTIEGKVLKGRCLKCHPVEGYLRRPPNHAAAGSPAVGPTYSSGPQHHHLSSRTREHGIPVSQPIPPPTASPSPHHVVYRRSSANEEPQPEALPPLERAQTSVRHLVQSHRPSLPPQFRQPMAMQQLLYEQQQQEQILLQQQQQRQTQLDYHQEAPSGIKVPTTLEVYNDNDDVSVLTMDYRLMQGSSQQQWNSSRGGFGDDEAMLPPIPSQRPGPDMTMGDLHRELFYEANRSRPGPSSNRSSYRNNGAGGMAPPTTTLENVSSWAALEVGGPGTTSASNHHHRLSSRQQQRDTYSNYATNNANGFVEEQGLHHDLMPPGGMDDLFRNRTGRTNISPTMHHEEIRYEPEPPPPTSNNDRQIDNAHIIQEEPALQEQQERMMMKEYASPDVIEDGGGPIFGGMAPGHQDLVSSGLRQNSGAHGDMALRSAQHQDATMDAYAQRYPSKESNSASTLGRPMVHREERGIPDQSSPYDPMVTEPAQNIAPQDTLGMTFQQSDSPPNLSATPSSKKLPPAPAPQETTPAAHTPGLKDPPPASNLKAPPPSSNSNAQDPSQHTNNIKKSPPAPSPQLVEQTLRSLSIVGDQRTTVNTETPGAVAGNKATPGAMSATGNGQTMHDIPVIMHCLRLQQATTFVKEKALRNLAGILWTSGPKARDFVIQYNGVETLIQTIWDDIGSTDLQDAAAEFLLSLAASSDGRAQNDLLANQENVCDSLLFAMQTHAHVASIQLKGCAIFSCLAAASSNNPKVSDGSLSGALMIVLAAMGNHPKSLEIQKAGLQTLYYQCSLSRDAESNKRSLLENHLEDGSSGLVVILNCMRSPLLQDDLVAMEWACRLCWLLTSSEDLVNRMAGMPSMLGDVLQTCQRFIPEEASGSLVEACFGLVGNLAHVESNRRELASLNAIGTLLQGMRYRQDDFNVIMEGCMTFANLSHSSELSTAFLDANGLEGILKAMSDFVDREDLVVEGLRALVGFSIQAPQGKEAMTRQQVVEFILSVGDKHKSSNSIQEVCCMILASLCVSPGACNSLIDWGAFDWILSLLKPDIDEPVVDAACSVYRNLTCQVDDVDQLLTKGALRSLIECMSTHSRSASIQLSICGCICNVVSRTNKDPGELVGQKGVGAIVKAMQDHMESNELLEFACGALWIIVDENIERRKDIVACGAIDAIYCTMAMHPTATSTLIKACGIFSNLSVDASLAEAIASSSEGVGAVSDAMRNNASSIEFLEIGCLTLRNIVYQFPDYAQEASMAISPVITAMRENLKATSFQREACDLLWVLATEAESCQSKILALDGISVLMQTIDQNSHDPRCHEAAMGAFTHLAMNGNT